MDVIGGYFELEFLKRHNFEFWSDPVLLNSGKSCLEYIFLTRRYSKIYLPHYICDAVMDSLTRLKVEIEYYDINNQLEAIFDFNRLLGQTECFFYINYFGVKNNYIKNVLSKIPNLIIDNAQALFSKPIPGIDTFYSPRKFIGCPDGGILCTNQRLNDEFEREKSFDHMMHLLIRIDQTAEDGYSHYRTNEDRVRQSSPLAMSTLTKSIIQNTDIPTHILKRRQNYQQLHNCLNPYNLLSIDLDLEDVPMVYPFRTKKTTLLDILKANGIYCATYWPNVISYGMSNQAYFLAKEIIPIPIDQRYSSQDMQRILDIVTQESYV